MSATSGTSVGNLNLVPRGKPKQLRAHVAFERILTATAELICELGIDRITTIQVAERAKVNVSTLYRYFPNKYALVTYLAQQLSERQNAAVNDYLAAVDPSLPWEQVLDGIVDAMVGVSRKEVAFVPLQRALMAVPELREEYRRSSEDVSELLTEFLRRWGIALPPTRARLIVTCMGECSAGLLDLAVSGDLPYDDDVVSELKRVFRGYVKTYIES